MKELISQIALAHAKPSRACQYFTIAATGDIIAHEYVGKDGPGLGPWDSTMHAAWWAPERQGAWRVCVYPTHATPSVQFNAAQKTARG